MREIKKFFTNPKVVRKAWIVICATVAGALAQGLITGAAAAWITVVIGGLTTAGVWAVANENDTGV